MTVSLDIEEMLEDAYIALLEANAYITANSIPVRRWRDADNDKVYPVIVVHADNVSTDPIFNNTFLATPALVSVSCMTAKRVDTDGADVNTLRNEIRGTLSSATIVDELNAESPQLLVYDNGVFWGSASQDGDTNTIRRRDIQQEVTATMIDYPLTVQARYKFASTDFLGDSSGGADLTNNNDVTNPDDATRGYVAAFDGVDQYFSGAYTGNSTGAASWSMWFNTNISASRVLLGGATNNFIREQDSTQIDLGIDGTLLNYTVSITLQSWHLLIVTRDSLNNWRVYLDGVESSTGAQSSSNSLTVYNIGRRDSSNYWDGEIDDVQYYTSALTQSQITAIYNKDLK